MCTMLTFFNGGTDAQVMASIASNEIVGNFELANTSREANLWARAKAMDANYKKYKAPVFFCLFFSPPNIKGGNDAQVTKKREEDEKVQLVAENEVSSEVILH